MARLEQAVTAYEAALKERTRDREPLDWAATRNNIADLALARFRLDPDPAHLIEARNYLAKARAFFVEGSEYQTQRCDELLAEIEAAERG